MRRKLGIVAVAMILAACTADPYPFPAQVPPCCAQLTPAAIGEDVLAVVLFIPARPDVQLELLGAEAMGRLDGATVALYSSAPVDMGDGTTSIGERLDALAGTVIGPAQGASSDPAETIGLVAVVTPHRAGRYVLSGLRLRYRINGGAERTGDGIEVAFTVCADDPKPESCDEEGV